MSHVTDVCVPPRRKRRWRNGIYACGCGQLWTLQGNTWQTLIILAPAEEREALDRLSKLVGDLTQSATEWRGDT